MVTLTCPGVHGVAANDILHRRLGVKFDPRCHNSECARGFNSHIDDLCQGLLLCLTSVITGVKQQFYIALFLIAFGKAATNTTFPSFFWEQKETIEGEERNLVEVVFYGIIHLGLLATAVFVFPWLTSWSVLFGVASFTMFFLFFKLLRACCSYEKVNPSGSPLISVAWVFTSSFFKMFLHPPEDASQLHELQLNHNEEEVLEHTDALSCLDKAAIIQRSGSEENAGVYNKWMLCTVTQVEQAKVMLRMIPMWASFLIPGLVLSIGNTYFTEVADGLNRKIFGIELPLTYLQMMYNVHKKSAKKVYSNFRYGDAAEEDERKHVSFVVTVLGNGYAVACLIVAALVEMKRLAVVKKYDLEDDSDTTVPMSFLWLLPQFIMLGRAGAYFQKGINGFYNDQLPKAMREYAGPFADGALGAGTILGVVAIRAAKGWFGTTVNNSHLDYFYWVLAVLGFFNIFVLWFIGRRYPYKEVSSESEEEEIEAPEFDDGASALTRK
ncbi:Proton-dependent oligopeptide transporter family [Dillenia turbinata]|uniref:Proton-dependent oligopeptide transporter family n=1 Tax=Dillenia turbinata TaxID=194707 RepID=A0AAN8WAT8_9MAGN